MSLVSCGECGEQISDRAKSCPRCGTRPRRNWRPKLAVGVAVILPVLFVLVAGSSSVRSKGYGPEGRALENTEEELRKHLKDPDSMVIRSAYPVVRNNPGGSNKHIHICGLVDGKNSFGAYAGAVRFVSYSIQTPNSFETHSVEVEDPLKTSEAHDELKRSDFERMYWDPNCSSAP